MTEEELPHSPYERATPWFLGVAGSLFLALTAFVHGDTGNRALPPPSPAAVRGQAIFRRQYCQVCHQVYGLGGFAGPDLTNAASRVGEQRIRAALAAGFRGMPPQKVTLAETNDLLEYLKSLDATGCYPRPGWPGEGLPQ